MSSNSASVSPEQAQVSVPTNKEELMAAIDAGTLASVMERMQAEDWQLLRTEKRLRDGLNGANAAGEQIGLRREIREFLGLAPAQVDNQAAERAEEVAALAQMKAEISTKMQNTVGWDQAQGVGFKYPAEKFLENLERAVRLLHEAETKNVASSTETPAVVVQETAAAAVAAATPEKVVEPVAVPGSRANLIKAIGASQLPGIMLTMDSEHEDWQIMRTAERLQEGLNRPAEKGQWERHGLRNEIRRFLGLNGLHFGVEALTDAVRAEESSAFVGLEKDIRDQLEYLEAKDVAAGEEFLKNFKQAMDLLHAAEKPVETPAVEAPAEPAPAPAPAPAETFPESIQKIVTEAKGGALKARVDEMKREGHTWQVMRNKEILDRDLVNVGNRQGLQRELDDLIGPVDAATDFTAAHNFRNKALPALQRALKGQEAQPGVKELLKALDVATRALVDAETAATSRSSQPTSASANL